MNLTMNRPTTFAIGVIAIVAVCAIAFTALRARADTAPILTQVLQNNSNVQISSASIGSSIHDVVGISSSTNATLPTGTVDFSSFGNTTCSGTPTVQASIALVQGFATSSATSIGATGISYLAHYNGDANNVAATSSCVVITPTSQSVTIANQLSTSTSVLAGSIISDTAVLSSATSGATGTVAYNVYSNNSCTALSVGAGNFTVTNAVVPASNAVQFNFAGTYFWQAVYSGDQNNSAATTSCTALVVVATSTPQTGTTTPPVIAPGHHHDNDGDEDDNATTTDNGTHGHGHDGNDDHGNHQGHHDNGKHLGWFKNGKFNDLLNNVMHFGKKGNDNDKGDNDQDGD